MTAPDAESPGCGHTSVPPADPAPLPACEGRALQPLGAYEPPSMPADEAAQQVLHRLRAFLWRKDDAPVITDDELDRATRRTLDAAVAPPACGPAHADLAQAFAEWENPTAKKTLRLVVVPPCDENDVVGTCARRRGEDVLAPPPRAALAGRRPHEPPALDGDGLLVIPQLERWFLRHRNGLRTVRMLLTEIHESGRRCLVGCNSWAWKYLVKAVDADLFLPEATTFQPFDAERLRDWFAGLAEATAFAFRSSGSGDDVFADCDAASDRFRELAARSLGIPWVAWHLWRRSLFRSREAAQEGEGEREEERLPEEAVPGELPSEARGDDRPTLWVGRADEVALPSKHPQAVLLTLHALLLHGALTPDEIRTTVPVVGTPNLVPALRAAGIVEHVERPGNTGPDAAGAIRCRAAAYPVVRKSLADGGFPLGQL